MLDRLQGLENEYALHFEPASPAVARPDHHGIFLALKDAMSWLLDIAPGPRSGREQFFVSNGGSFCYESLASAYDGGLIEGATPECRGPGQTLLYQRAQERLLLLALPRVEEALEAGGNPGELGLLRNCRDAEGHIYGSQENYEALVAEGPALLALRLCLAVAMVVSLFVAVAMWALALVVIVVGVPLMLTALFTAAMMDLRPASEYAGTEDRALRLWRWMGAALEQAEIVITAPLVLPWLLALRLFAFRRPRRALTAFLVSRPVVVGTGTLDGDVFGLSEKGPAVRRVLRWQPLPAQRPIFDFGNLCKPLLMPFFGRMLAPLTLASSRQRLQLGLSSGNRADVAEFLKVGAMSLLLDLCEDGALHDAPRVRRPVQALHAVSADVSLTRKLPTSHGPMTALEIQRWYLERASRWVSAQGAAHPEASRLLALWREALDGLESDPSSLSGVLDWPTKRALIDAARSRVDGAALKKLDLRYHQLGERGYFTQLQQAGLTRRLVSDEEIERAVDDAPRGSPAWQRSQLMRVHQGDANLRVAWDTIRTGRGLRAEVIPLDRFR